MKRTLLVAIASLLAALPVGAQKSHEVFRQTGVNGKDLVFRIPEEKLSKEKSWDPGTEELPLSIARAVAIASKEASPANPKDFAVFGIRLNCVRVTGQLRWYYFVHGYRLSEAKGPEPPPSVDILVLMTGDVIQPVEEPSRADPAG